MQASSVWILGLRNLWRDLRAGELRLIIVAVLLAVAALSSVGFFADRLQAGLQRDARQLLGGEVVVVRMHDDEVMLKVFTGIRDDKVVLDSLNSGYDRQLRPLQDVVFIHQVVAKVTSAKIVKAP